jgi:CHAT domain-containing protein
VLCTRWEARDLVSLLIRDHFYTALQQGRPPAQALRDAQIAVRELTGQQLAAQIERWDTTGHVALETDPLNDRELVTREPAELDLGTIRDMWRGQAPELIAAFDQPAVQPSTLETRPFADPLFWAPFMLVGRA